MLDLEAKFSPRIIPASTEYPYGKLKPNTATASNDGTPVTAALGNDIEGFKQAVITRANIDPSGAPDNAVNSQLLDSLDKRYLEIDYQTWTFETGGLLTDCSQAVKHTDNKWYSWSGVFPEGGKVVTAGTNPATDGSGYIPRVDVLLRGELAAVGSDVLISGVEAGVVAGAADDVRAVTLITGSGAQSVSAAQIGSSILFTVATAVAMPTTASLNGVTGHYRIMAGSNPITLTRIDGTSFTVRGGSVSSVTIPAGSDCYVAYSASGVYVYGLATYETIVKSYCLVNALGTGAPNELVSAALPANLAINSRYVLTNPFGANTPVHVTAELLLDGKWANPGFGSNIGTGTSSLGTAAHYVQGEGIVVQTGNIAIANSSVLVGGGHGRTSTTSVTSAPCRVFIQKVGV